MSEFLNIDKTSGIYELIGCFDKFTIPSQWKEIKSSLKVSEPKVVDLSRVGNCDSALIALLVEIKRDYPKIGIKAAPENLILLLDLYQVKQLLF